MFNLYVNKSPN